MDALVTGNGQLCKIGLMILIAIIMIAVVALCVIPCVRKMLIKGMTNMSFYEALPSDSDAHSPEGYREYLAVYREKKKKNHII